MKMLTSHLSLLGGWCIVGIPQIHKLQAMPNIITEDTYDDIKDIRYLGTNIADQTEELAPDTRFQRSNQASLNNIKSKQCS